MIVNAGGGASGSFMTPYEYAVASGYGGTADQFEQVATTRCLQYTDSSVELPPNATNFFIYGSNMMVWSDGDISSWANSTACFLYGPTTSCTWKSEFCTYLDNTTSPPTFSYTSSSALPCTIALGDGHQLTIGSSGMSQVAAVMLGSWNSMESLLYGNFVQVGSQNTIKGNINVGSGVYQIGNSNRVEGGVNTTAHIIMIGVNNKLESSMSNNWADYNSRYLSNGTIWIGEELGFSQVFNDPYTGWEDFTHHGQVMVGYHNSPTPHPDSVFIVAVGDYSGNKNGLRVTSTEVLGLTYKSSGADYAENFEWQDGNTEHEDRCGRFVTLDEDKIRLAQPDDDFILGIISGDPSVVGDTYDDQWKGMNERDVFGRYLWEDVEVPDEYEGIDDPDNEGQKIQKLKRPAHTEHVLKINPNYNPQEKYIPRSQRPEWDAVGMMGKLVACDDGTCQPNGWATVGVDGIAVHSDARTKYRVMKRIDESHVQILIL